MIGFGNQVNYKYMYTRDSLYSANGCSVQYL